MKLEEYKNLCINIANQFKIPGAENPVLNLKRIRAENDKLKLQITQYKQRLAQLERDYYAKSPDNVKEQDKDNEYYTYVGGCCAVTVAHNLANEVFEQENP